MTDADDLLENAEAAKARLEQAGLSSPALDAALAAFRALPPDQRTPDRQPYADLVLETSRALRTPSASTEPEVHRSRERLGFALTVGLCIVLSVASMVVVAQLSMVYRDGQAVLSDLKRLKDSKTERRFSELQRQLVYAGKVAAQAARPQPDAGTSGDRIALDSLAAADRTQALPPAADPAALPEDPIAERMAIAQYYGVLFDLRELDRDIFSVMTRFQTFWQDSYQPVSFLSGPVKIWRGLSGQEVADATPEYRELYAKAKKEGELATADAARFDPCKPLFDKVKGETDPARNANWIKVLSESVSACRFSFDHLLSYNSSALPIFDTYIHETNYRLTPYSTWVMPMAFAVFGALLYYMRFLMNPLLPSPRLSRILHRVSLSALAGVVISLVWSNISSVGAEFQTAGFTVFAVCFLAGFSTDMFFSNLDRWVASASSVGLGKAATPDERQKIVDSAHG